MELQSSGTIPFIHREVMCDIFEFESPGYSNENFIHSDTSSLLSSTESETSSGRLPVRVPPQFGPPTNSIRIVDRRPLHSSPVPLRFQSFRAEMPQTRRFSFPMENYQNRRNAISTDQSSQLEIMREQLTQLRESNRLDNRREIALTIALILMIILVYIITIVPLAHLAEKAENRN